MHKIRIYTCTTFGHGDSSTDVFAICTKCQKRSITLTDYGFPAEYDTMRAVQADLNKMKCI